MEEDIQCDEPRPTKRGAIIDGIDINLQSESMTFSIYFEMVMEVFEKAMDQNQPIHRSDVDDFVKRCEGDFLEIHNWMMIRLSHG